MNPYFLKITKEEQENILNKHKTLYDGYAVKQNIPNQQPLYVQDFANDKGGITVNNKGEVKKYSNVGINESLEENKKICSECGLYENVCECGLMEDSGKVCEQCGSSKLVEGECMECGGNMLEYETDNNMNDSQFDYVNEKLHGGQKKLDKNKNGKLDKEDFKILRGDVEEEIDDEIKESFIIEKNKINEMFNRFKKYN